MSHIMNFSITGLAGRKQDFECKLNRDDNIFFGLNGSGKTSLLKILHSAMTNDGSILTRVPFTSATVRIYSVSFKKVFTRSIVKPKEWPHRKITERAEYLVEMEESERLASISRTEERKLKWDTKPKTPKEANRTHWHHQYLPTTRLHLDDEPIYLTRDWRGAPTVGPTEDEMDILFARSVERLWSHYSAQILSAIREAQEQGLTGILGAVLSSKSLTRRGRQRKLDVDAAYDRVKTFLSRQDSISLLGPISDFEQRYRDDATLQAVVKDIDQVEEKIKKAMESRNHLQKLIHKMISGNKQITFTDQSIDVETFDGKHIGLISLSSGEKQLLRILVETLLAAESTIIIDEPEISIHVDWQRELLAAMRALNPHAQIIIATHSPEIMSDISDDKVFHL